MNLAVRLWSDLTNKPVGLPDLWPGEVWELGESTSLPAGNWVLMTLAEYNAYRALHKSSYDEWEASQG